MGMYTEFHFNAELKQDVPLSVVGILKYMVENNPRDTLQFVLPDNPLFGDTLWRFMLQCDSYYFDADTHSTLRYDQIANAWILCIRCNLKNYSHEIESFIEWIKPYLNKEPGDFLGFYRYEETETPTLIYM
jgi:hypothetical protein